MHSILYRTEAILNALCVSIYFAYQTTLQIAHCCPHFPWYYFYVYFTILLW